MQLNVDLEQADVIFRVDASQAVGLGHLTRCLLVADELRRRGLRSSLFVTRDSPAAEYLLRAAGYPYVFIPEGLTSAADAAQLLGLATSLAPKLVVVDLLGLEETYLAQAAPEKTLLVTLLDEVAPETYHTGLVFNHNFAWFLGRHPTRELPNYFGGPPYVLLHPECRRLAQRKSSAAVRRIFLNQGGGDPFGLTAFTLHALESLPDKVEVHCVLGAAQSDIEQVREAFANTPLWLELYNHLSHERMINLMASCDLAHTAGGNTLYELLALGVPAVVLSHHARQAAVARAFAAEGAVVDLGIGAEALPEALLEATRRLIDSPEERARLAARGQELVDGLGTARTVDKILTAL